MRFGVFFNFSKQARIKRLLMRWVTGYHLLRKLWQYMNLVLLWWCASTAWFVLLKCHHVKKHFWSSGFVKWRLKARLWHQPERSARVRRGWGENVDSPGRVCSSHEIQKELVLSSSPPKLWQATCRWGKDKSSLINPSCSSLPGWVQELGVLLCF